VKYSRATLFFKARASCSKILNDKKYIFSAVKNSRATLFFRASASCSQILNAKSIFNINTVKNSRATVFQDKRELLKFPECKTYIQCSKKFQGNSVFQSKRELLNNPE